MTRMNGIQSIAAERRRQIVSEGWTAEHDDEHKDESLALVAALYAAPGPLFEVNDHRSDDGFGRIRFDDPWPASWDTRWDKRWDHDRRRCLAIAGALIAAEIDRLDRIAESRKESR